MANMGDHIRFVDSVGTGPSKMHEQEWGVQNRLTPLCDALLLQQALSEYAAASCRLSNSRFQILYLLKKDRSLAGSRLSKIQLSLLMLSDCPQQGQIPTVVL